MKINEKKISENGIKPKKLMENKSKIFVKLFLIDKIKEIVLIGITYW